MLKKILFQISIKKKNQTTPYFSKEYKKAHFNHKNICQNWRLAGRPQEQSHPAKKAKIISPRKLQQIARNDESEKAIKQHDEL